MTTPLEALPRPPQLRAVLLDAGNTLVFLDHQAVADVAHSLGERLTAQALRDAMPEATRSYERLLHAGGSHADGWALFMTELFRHAGAPSERLDSLVRAARCEHDQFNLWRAVPDGLTEALGRLREAGLRVGVVSNSEGKLDALFDRVGLAPFLDLVVDSALEGVRKPDPELFHRALDRLGVAPAQALYAGDIPAVDVQGARAAGMAGVLVDTPNQYPDYHEAPKVRSVAELVSRLL